MDDFDDFLDLALFDDFLEAPDLDDLGDLAARLSSLERRDRLLSSELTVSRVPRATENAKNVAMKRTPFSVKNALALNLEKLDSAPPDLYPLLEWVDEPLPPPPLPLLLLPPELPSQDCP